MIHTIHKHGWQFTCTKYVLISTKTLVPMVLMLSLFFANFLIFMVLILQKILTLLDSLFFEKFLIVPVVIWAISLTKNLVVPQADDLPVSFWCAFRIFSHCLFDRSYQMLTEKATFSNTLGKGLLKVITLMLNTATGLWQSQQTETGLWRRKMFCNVLPFFHTSNKGKTLPCAKT